LPPFLSRHSRLQKNQKRTQAVRLWGLGADDCRHVLDSLADAGFLKWTPRRTVVRA
jgi:hypothetical protein